MYVSTHAEVVLGLEGRSHSCSSRYDDADGGGNYMVMCLPIHQHNYPDTH